MRRTENLGLTQYETSDKFRITDENDSLNKDMQIIDDSVKNLQDDSESLYKTQGALAILCNGNTHPSIPRGKYLYIKNHPSLPDGFYISQLYIPENANLAFSEYVIAVDADGCINALNMAIANVQSLFSQTPSQPIPLNSRCTITNGGYIIIGKICFISVKITGAYTATNVPLIMQIPNISCNESCLSCEQHGASTSEAIPCYIDVTGRIGVGSITSGKLYNISGIAFIS